MQTKEHHMIHYYMHTVLTFFISWNSSDNIRLMWSCCNACSTGSHGSIHNATPTLINLLRVSPAARRTFWSCDPQNANSCSRAFPNSLGNMLWCLVWGDADTNTIGLYLTSQWAVLTTRRHSLITGWHFVASQPSEIPCYFLTPCIIVLPSCSVLLCSP